MKDNSINTKLLDQLIKSMGKKAPSIKIGILGNNARKDDSSQASNAEIGLMHEFGTENMEARSFLRMPLTDHLDQYIEDSGILKKDYMKEVISNAKSGQSITFRLAQKLAVIAETVVLDAFDTGGFGTWKPSDMDKKKNHQTLVETQQLRNSISTEIVE